MRYTRWDLWAFSRGPWKVSHMPHDKSHEPHKSFSTRNAFLWDPWKPWGSHGSSLASFFILVHDSISTVTMMRYGTPCCPTLLLRMWLMEPQAPGPPIGYHEPFARVTVNSLEKVHGHSQQRHSPATRCTPRASSAFLGHNQRFVWRREVSSARNKKCQGPRELSYFHFSLEDAIVGNA